jgi:hypothetical protein
MYKSARGSRLTSLTISYTRSTTYKSVRDSRWAYLTISYTRSTTYKSVMGSRMMFQPSLILFTRTRGSRSTLHIASIFCSSADIIINGLARPLTPPSLSPSIHQNAREQLSMRSSSIMIGYVGLDRLISFIG